MNRPYRNYKDSEAAIKSFASRVLQRLRAAGAKTEQFEDIIQELSLIWCNCCQTYDPASGATFNTYLHGGMRLYINSWVRKHVDQRHAEVIALDLDGFGPSGDGGEDEGTLGDALPSEIASPDEVIANLQSLDYVKSRLSERAQMFVTILNDQPQELLNEVMKLEDKAAYAKEHRGITINLSHRLTYVMILDLMGASRGERKQILDEVTAVSDHYCRQVA